MPMRVRPPHRYGVPMKRSATSTKSRGGAAQGHDVANGNEAAVVEFGEFFVAAAHGDDGVQGQMLERRRLDVGDGIEKRAQRLDAMIGDQHLARQRVGGHIADVLVALQLHPRPPVGFVEDGGRLAVEGFRLEAAAELRRLAQRHRSAQHLRLKAVDEAHRINLAFQIFGGKTRPKGVTAGIERLCPRHRGSGRLRHRDGLTRTLHCLPRFAQPANSVLSISRTARAVCGSPPLGPNGRAAGRQP